MLCILFYFNLRLKYIVKIYFYFVVNTREYPWISVDIKKLCGYPHNGYLTNMGTIMGQIGYVGATTRTLPVPWTSLLRTFIHHFPF